MNDLTDVKHIEATQLCQSQALRIAEIHPSPTNPRKTFPEAEMAEMVDSVKRHGVMQAILVRPWPEAYAFEGERPTYELIAGERRYRAAKAAGLEFISATVRDLDDHETLELQIVENLHRKDLNELEEAEGYEMMVKRYGYTAEQLAEKIDKSKAYIYARLKLTAAGEAARTAFRAGELDASRLLLIARIPTAGLQQQALEEITKEHWNGPMNYREAAKHVQQTYMLDLTKAPFSIDDIELVADAGQCSTCPKRTGNTPELYADVKNADVCTDTSCFAAKKTAHFGRIKDISRAQGKVIISGEAAEKILRNGEWSIKGFHKLDEKCYDAAYDNEKKSYPTYRELIADKGTPVTLIEKPDGSLIETVEQSAFKTIAAEVGIEAKASNNSDKERGAKEKAENEFRQRLFDQVSRAYQESFDGPGYLDNFSLRLIARQFFSCTWNEHQKKLATRWLPSEEKIDSHERIQRLTQQIDTMPEERLYLFMVELALIGMSHVGSYGATETPPPFLAAAQHMLISPDTIRREIKAEQDAKAASKNKKATKNASQEYAEGNYIEVIAYETNKDLIGSIGQVKAVGRAIASGKPIYTLMLADGSSLVADSTELASATLEQFEDQQDERNPSNEEPPAVARSNRVITPIAYRHPENNQLGWTGRGRQPKWVEHWLAQDGNTLEQLAVGQQRCDKTIDIPGL